MKQTKLLREFQSPPADFRAKPFWAWNGKLEEQELLRQIDIMREMGFGGFFMHSRTGLQTRYLGRDWFRLTDACARSAQKQGLEPWIYDEDRWPSGCAGGYVTEDKALRRKVLTLTLGEPEREDTVLAAFAARVDGLYLHRGYRQLKDGEAPGPGESKLTFCVHTMQPQSVYNGFTDSDRLSLAATERFLEVTHRQYAASCEAFHALVGVFTDEPHRGLVFSDFSDPGQRQRWSLPWTDDLAQAFEDRFSQPLLPALPELFLQLEGERVSKLKWQYMELLQRLFLERFLQPIQQWAHANGKRTTGHFLHEDSLMAQAAPTGSMMRCYAYLDEPGIDSLTQTRYTPWAVKQLESAARQLGKTKKLSELYGATGWQMSFADYKYVGDWQVLLGINVRCPHLSWYTMQGEAKRDYPGSFLHQATWYQEYAELEAYFARLGYLVSQGRPICDTLVLHPVESLWYQIHPEWANALDAADPAIQRLEQQFRQLFDWLMRTQTDFDYGDEGLLEQLATVERDADGAILHVGKMSYRRIVVGGCESIRETTWALLKAFTEAGGSVIWVGQPPRYVGGTRSAACRALAARGTRLPMRKQAVLAYFRAQNRPLSILDPTDADALYLQLRQTEDGVFALLWNRDRRAARSAVRLRLPEGTHAELWDCRTAERNALADTDGCVRLDFAPGQERVLFLSTTQSTLPPVSELPRSQPLSLPEPCGYTLNEPNVLVLDRAALWLEDRLFSEPDELLQLDGRLRRALGLRPRGGEMLQPWAQTGEVSSVPIRLRFTVNIETLPAAPITLAMEPLPAQTLSINGVPVPLEKAEGFWVDQCFGLYAVPREHWKPGENTLELTAAYSARQGLEAIYLLGDFGVWFRGTQSCIGALPKRLRIGDLTRQGLPFYSGKVRYHFEAPVSGTCYLSLPKLGGSCARVCCGEQQKLLLWSWESARLRTEQGSALVIEAVLTRRNTFGPLHRFPRTQPYIAPDSFTCDDAKRFCLYPTGLLAQPELRPEPS